MTEKLLQDLLYYRKKNNSFYIQLEIKTLKNYIEVNGEFTSKTQSQEIIFHLVTVDMDFTVLNTRDSEVNKLRNIKNKLTG